MFFCNALKLLTRELRGEGTFLAMHFIRNSCPLRSLHIRTPLPSASRTIREGTMNGGVPAMTGAPIVPWPERIRSRVYMSIVVSPVHLAFRVNSTEHRSHDPSHVQSYTLNQASRLEVLLSIITCHRYLVNPGVSSLTYAQEIRPSIPMYLPLSLQDR